MKRAIITGASGFIGYHLTKELLQQDYEVLAVVHSSEGATQMDMLQNERLSTVICDIPDFSNLYKEVSGIYDVFFHMAWQGVSGADNRNSDVQMRNIKGAVSAVRTAGRVHCKRFLGAGSLHETECLKEMGQSSVPQNFANYYKSAKLAAHYFCKLEAAEQKIDFLWPRLTNTFGAGERSARLINTTVRKLLAGESPAFTAATQLYNFIYITDVARAYRLLAERGRPYQEYILGSEEVVPLKKYLLKVQELVNPNVRMDFGKHPFQGVFLDREELHSDVFLRIRGFKQILRLQMESIW